MHNATPTSRLSVHSSNEAALYRRVTWRLLPFLFLCYVVAYLDRVNVGFAKLQMLADLKMSDTAYGLGAGIFFIGYFLFEVPSNLLLHRLGARVWIARIMMSWGVLSALTMFVTSTSAFYGIRFALGLAEAGFFPGIVFYLTQWFPSSMRARIIALFMTAVAISGVIGGPLSGFILRGMAGVNGWSGWQWLFLIEGIPSIVMGVAVFFYLDDSIDSARWLTASEKLVLHRNLVNEEEQKQPLSIADTFRSRRVLSFAALYFTFTMGLYGVGFWLPQIIKNMGVKSLLDVGLLSAIPYGVAAITMVFVARRSDHTGERQRYLVVSALCGGVGLALAGVAGQHTMLGMLALTLGTTGVLTTFPLFWTLPTAFLSGASAAAGIAIINSLGNLSGFLSPYIVGAIADATGSATIGLYVLAASMFVGAVFAQYYLPAQVEVTR